MDNNSIAALIIVSGTPLAAITALVLSHRGFASTGTRLGSLDGRFEALDSRLASTDSRFASIHSGFESIERRLDMLHTDLRDLHGRMKVAAADMALIKDKLSL